jgi:hypothetical protein
MRRFTAGLLLGAVASLSVSVGLIATIFVFVVMVLLGVAFRSLAMVSGGLIGWGLSWTFFFYVSFGGSMCNGPGCDQGRTALPFLAVAVAIALSGLVAGLIGLARLAMRHRAARSG